MKPQAGCWQTALVQTHEFLNAISMPSAILAVLIVI